MKIVTAIQNYEPRRIGLERKLVSRKSQRISQTRYSLPFVSWRTSGTMTEAFCKFNQMQHTLSPSAIIVHMHIELNIHKLHRANDSRCTNKNQRTWEMTGSFLSPSKSLYIHSCTSSLFALNFFLHQNVPRGYKSFFFNLTTHYSVFLSIENTSQLHKNFENLKKCLTFRLILGCEEIFNVSLIFLFGKDRNWEI